MQKKYIFIDLDGTLVNTSKGIYYALDYCYDKMNLKRLSDNDKNVYIGPPLKPAFIKYANLNEQQAEECYQHFRKVYGGKGVLLHELYRGVAEMVKTLYNDKKTLVVATSKPEKFAKQILEHYDLAKYFKAICGASMDEKRVTKQQVLEYAFETIGITNSCEGILIGDTTNDVIGAHSVGMDCIGILYGFGSRNELEDSGADYIVSTPEDVLKILE